MERGKKKKIRVGGVKRWRRERENSIVDVEGKKNKRQEGAIKSDSK